MLVGFLGAPCSGKTTTAALTFAELKDMGIPTEFIVEKARTFIAFKRYACQQSGETFTLTDEDQVTIARSQHHAEKVMKAVGGKHSILVVDTCVINSLLYMSEDRRNQPDVQALAKEALAQYDLLFVCDLVPRPVTDDPNRVHSMEESVVLHDQLISLLEQYPRESAVITLAGESKFRLREVIVEILNRIGDST